MFKLNRLVHHRNVNLNQKKNVCELTAMIRIIVVIELEIAVEAVLIRYSIPFSENNSPAYFPEFKGFTANFQQYNIDLFCCYS